MSIGSRGRMQCSRGTKNAEIDLQCQTRVPCAAQQTPDTDETFVRYIESTIMADCLRRMRHAGAADVRRNALLLWAWVCIMDVTMPVLRARGAHFFLPNALFPCGSRV